MTDEIEDKAFHKIYKELKKPPAKIFKNETEFESTKSRNLIRTFFKQKAKKEDKHHNTVEECAYYDLFQVRDTVYHLIENQHLKQDMLVQLTENKLEFPVLYNKYSKTVVKDRVLRVRKIF